MDIIIDDILLIANYKTTRPHLNTFRCLIILIDPIKFSVLGSGGSTTTKSLFLTF